MIWKLDLCYRPIGPWWSFLFFFPIFHLCFLDWIIFKIYLQVLWLFPLSPPLISAPEVNAQFLWDPFPKYPAPWYPQYFLVPWGSPFQHSAQKAEVLLTFCLLLPPTVLAVGANWQEDREDKKRVHAPTSWDHRSSNQKVRQPLSSILHTCVFLCTHCHCEEPWSLFPKPEVEGFS